MHTRNDVTAKLHGVTEEPSPPQNRNFPLHILFLTLVYHEINTGNQT